MLPSIRLEPTLAVQVAWADGMKAQPLLSDRRTSEDRHSVTARFAVLNDLNLRLAQEHDTAALIDKVCTGARADRRALCSAGDPQQQARHQ
jgi:hypothetical protein